MTPYFETSDVTIYQADSRTAWRDLPEHSADAIVTSPPYWGLRSYLPDTVQLRRDLTDDEREAVISEMESLGIFPIGDGV